MMKADVLIIGCGPAGSCAAFAAKKANPDLCVVVTTKEAHSEYSAPALPDYLSGEIDREMLFVRKANEYKKAGIQLLSGEDIVKIDREKKVAVSASGKEISYGKLVLAMGSFPIQLRKMPGTNLPGNFVTKTIDDIEAILGYKGKSAVVVGSGAIGLEGSMALKARGYEKVTMVEALDWLSPKSLDKACSDKLTQSLNSFGVEVLAGESVQGVEGTDKVTGVVTSKRTIPCDIILWGIGMRPEVTLAKEAGLEIGELGGIVVDERMQTSDPDIYACGDCVQSVDRLTGQPAMHLFWEPAQRGGEAAGLNCAGGEAIYDGSTAIFLTHKGGLAIAAFGRTEDSYKGEGCVVLEENTRKSYRRLIFEKGKLTGAQMVNTMEDVDLLLDQITKNSVVRPGAWDLSTVIEDLDGKSVRDCINYFRKERRALLK